MNEQAGYSTKEKRLQRVFLAIVVLLFIVAVANSTERALYKTHRLSAADVAVSCADGGKPVVQEVATDKRVIIVSCPFEAEEKASRGGR